MAMTVHNNINLSEKVSVNINSSTLAAMDLLVDNGYYSNRSDFINQALREALTRNEPNIARCAERAGNQLKAGQWFMGVMVLTRENVEELLEQGRTVSISGYGVLVIDKAVPSQNLFNAVREIRVKGRVVCTEDEKQHYGLR